MNRRERKEIEAVIAELIADEGDHVSALERLCKLVGREVAPIKPGRPMGVLEVAAAAERKGANP